MKVDLEKAQGGVLPEGEHVCRVADATDAVSKNGNEMAVLDWVVVGGQHKGAEVRDWIVPHYFPDKFVDLVQSVGLDLPTPGSEFEVAKLIGLRARVVVYHDEHEGKKRAKVSGYSPLQEGDPDDPLTVPGPASDDVPF